MKELWLKFQDENDLPQNIRVKTEKFVIGRSPENDLCIKSNQLSRRHAEINRFDDVYVISDCGSSNGTTVNDRQLYNPAPLESGDLINLGGGLDIRVELIEAASQPKISAPVADDGVKEEPSSSAVATPAVEASAMSVNSATPSDSASLGLPKWLFIAAPIFGLFILVGAVGLLYLLGKGNEKPPENEYAYTPGKSDSGSRQNAAENDFENEDKTPTPKPASTAETATPAPSGSVETAPTPVSASSEMDKVERSALAFMRRIAVRDDTYYFTQKQLGEINGKIKTFQNSSALRENFKAVRRDAAKFEELAKSKNLKPQFLANAALAKIGNGNQNPLAVAQTMLPVLGELKITLGNELADENLLVIAAYDLGEQGKFRQMQSTLEALSKQLQGVPAGKIRTIWFLREKGKITEAEYDFALRFLAIGVITQNPKDFNVESEALTFN